MALCACRAVDVAPVDPLVVVETPVVWRGAEATLHSESFVGADTLPGVQVNGIPASVRHVDSLRIAVRMPDSVGAFLVRVELHDGGFALDSIATGGQLARVLHGRALRGAMQWPKRYGGRIVGNDYYARPSTVSMIDLANPSDVIRLPIPDSLSQPFCLNAGPGPSVSGGVVLSDCHGAQVWGYTPTNMFVKTDSGGNGPFAAHVGDRSWLVWTVHAYYRIQRGLYVMLQPLEGNRAILSPRGDRAAPADGWVDSSLGVPVFDLATISVVFRLPGASVGGADFSPDGDTLFMGLGMTRGPGPFRILAVDAYGGATLGTSDTITAYSDAVLAADPAQPWLYYMTFTTFGAGGRPLVTVLDRRTMRVVASLRIPDAQWSVPVSPSGSYWSMYLDASARRLYVCVDDYGVGGTEYEFSLLP